MDNKIQATIVSHTHWDRAWYVSFQEYRIRLVRLIDRLLHLLNTRPDYQVYMLDGQMAVLEDYLEVRPQRARVIQEYCRIGRIKVGPWYVLADEFLVSPEALIRNLMLGHRIGQEYGGVFKIGYVPDGFGHIAQLPQILRGFGIDNAYFWRGVGPEGERLGTEFEWRALDGSQVTTIWMPWGYHNISNIGYPIHWGDTSQMVFDMNLAIQQIRKAISNLQLMSHTPAILLMNGIDHAEAEPRLPEIIASANREIAGVGLYQGTLAEHLERVRAAQPDLPVFEGEFRWGKYSEILQGVYATRIHLKQANQRVETLLESYTEPLATLAWACGADVPDGTPDLLWTAWRWLLKNHPHDDIYGSGIDIVHDEMSYRFSQAEQIAQFLLRDSLRQIARQADFTGQPGMPILVFNPSGWDRHEIAVGDLDFDFDDPIAGDFQLVDGKGELTPCQVLADEQVFWMETLKPNRKRRVRVAFPVDVPACGYRTYYAQPARARNAAKVEETWNIRSNGAENRFLSFTIAPDGSLEVTEKASGHTYRGLNYYDDVEDAGDEYSYCPCEQHSQTVSTAGQSATVALLAQGPNLVTFNIQQVLEVPEGLSEDRQRRSTQAVILPITAKVTLYRNQPGLYIETEIENRARDHKLSAVFPSDLNPAQVMVDGAFGVMPRAVELPDSAGWVEDPTPLMHQRSFIDLSEARRGLAILNRGLPAVEVRRQPNGTQVELVLLRSVGWLSRDDLFTRRVAAGPLAPAPGGQCLGHQRYEYAILPHAGDWRSVYQAAYDYRAPLLVARADTHEGLDLHEMNITRDDPAQVKPIPWPRGGPNSEVLSLIRLEPSSLVLSALRRTEDGLGMVVRFYNIEREDKVAKLSCWLPLAAAYRLNLNEARLGELPVTSGHSLEIPVRGAEIFTCELRPASQEKADEL